MTEEEGGGEGLKSRSSASVSAKSKKSTTTKATKKSKSTSTFKSIKSLKKPPPNSFFSTETMCKCDATAKTSRTLNTTAGLSFAGKSIGTNGEAAASRQQNIARPVFCSKVDKAIGGALAFSQCDYWKDTGLNNRASCDAMVMPGAVIEDGTFQMRPSSQNEDVIIMSFGLSLRFTHVETKLSYIVDRIAARCTEGDRNNALRLLLYHPRFVACKASLQSFLGSNSNDFVVEHRMKVPFKVADSLVTEEEDPIFFGFEIQGPTDTGEIAETHVYFELKERGKKFAPVVTISGVDPQPRKCSTPKAGSNMFRGGNFSMGSIPEHVSFTSPFARRQDEAEDADDDSTIESEDEEEEEEEEEEEDDDSTYKDVEMKDDNDDNSEVERLRKQVEELQGFKKEMQELKNIVHGIYQSRSKDSEDSGAKSTSASTPKKKKTNEGSAASVADSKASRKSTATRGVEDRENKRKTNEFSGTNNE